MGKRRKNHRTIIKKIAKNRIFYLFQKAHEIFPNNKELSNRYVYLARRYAQRAKVAIPFKWKKRICNNCKKFLYPGMNYRIRLHSHKGKGSHVSLTCFECNHTTRYFIKTNREKKEITNFK
ncbi:MAG: ribonuclease P [Candidatus Lokiarchaeota archaeon]|nr:ribonuclease P [Candidatus Lokiarchaeota archaeon]